MHRIVALVLLLSLAAFAQQPSARYPNDPPALKSRTDLPPDDEVAPPRNEPAADKWIVPAGTRIPVSLRQAISTRNARAGDPIYGQTNFPIVVDEEVMIPAGTYVQGAVDSVKRAGRIKGKAELQFPPHNPALPKRIHRQSRRRRRSGPGQQQHAHERVRHHPARPREG